MVERGNSRKGVIQKPKSDSLVPLAYNVKVLCAVWDLMHYTFNLALKLIKGTNDEFTTSAHIAQNTCYKLAADYYTETLIEAVIKRI